jgi:hypothetical protein
MKTTKIADEMEVLSSGEERNPNQPGKAISKTEPSQMPLAA